MPIYFHQGYVPANFNVASYTMQKFPPLEKVSSLISLLLLLLLLLFFCCVCCFFCVFLLLFFCFFWVGGIGVHLARKRNTQLPNMYKVSQALDTNMFNPLTVDIIYDPNIYITCLNLYLIKALETKFILSASCYRQNISSKIFHNIPGQTRYFITYLGKQTNTYTNNEHKSWRLPQVPIIILLLSVSELR